MDFLFHALIMAGIYVILCTSLNLLVGYGGLFNIGHGAFYGVGAYTAALLVVHFGTPFPLDLLASGLLAGLFGIVIGLPSLRLKGDYLALSTYAFAIVMYTVFNNWMEVTRGPMGIPGVGRPNLLFFRADSMPLYFLLVVVVAAVCIFILNRIVHSPFGTSLTAIREDEIAALAAGKNVPRIKLTVFCIGAFFAGIAGDLYVRYMSLADPSAFVTDESMMIFSMVVFGGMASLRGSVVSALILVLFPEFLRFFGIPGFYAAQIQRMLFGGLLVLTILKRPQGLLGKLRF